MNNNETEQDKIELEELTTWGHLTERLLDILNGDYELDQAREDIKSFRNTKDYTGNNDKYFPPTTK